MTRLTKVSQKFVILCFPEKLRKEIIISPYRKPTQVDEERILRRLGKLYVKELCKLVL